jgi:hypothetical protein
MGLRGRTLRQATPVLLDIGAAITGADEAVRAQIRRTVPSADQWASPVIDFDGPVEAMLRRAEQVQPLAVFGCVRWDWDPTNQSATALSPRVLTRLQAPLLLLGALRPEVYGRVVVIAHPEAVNSTLIENAGRWSFWLEQLFTPENMTSREPDFDVLLLDGTMRPEEILRHIEQRPADLVAVAANSFEHAEAASTLNVVMQELLSRDTLPSVMLPMVDSLLLEVGPENEPAQLRSVVRA